MTKIDKLIEKQEELIKKLQALIRLLYIPFPDQETVSDIKLLQYEISALEQELKEQEEIKIKTDTTGSGAIEIPQEVKDIIKNLTLEPDDLDTGALANSQYREDQDLADDYDVLAKFPKSKTITNKYSSLSPLHGRASRIPKGQCPKT